MSRSIIAVLLCYLCWGDEILTCPHGSRQIGTPNADIGGCGLTNCDDRYTYNSVEDCMGLCHSDYRCKSFTFAAIGSDHATLPVCTIYDTKEQTQTWGNNQIMCEILKCPSGSAQIGGVNADIGGCGLEPCHERRILDSPDECGLHCQSNPNCKSFTYEVHGSICTLYDSVEPNQIWEANQIMCAYEGIQCPTGTFKPVSINNDIGGCGMEVCDDRKSSATIEACSIHCGSVANCVGFSWAPIGGGPDSMNAPLCTIYESRAPNQIWGTNQVFCAMYSSSIEVRETNDYDWIWNDADSGADLDGSFWKPKLLHSGEYFVSFVNRVGWDAPRDQISEVITYAPPNALADPIDYQWIWDDRGSGGDHDVWWFKPIAPIDYVCFGDFVSRVSFVPDLGGYKCIHKDYVTEIPSEEAPRSRMWTDAGSGANADGAVYKISVPQHPKQYYRMSSSYSDVSGPYYSFSNRILSHCQILSVDVHDKSVLTQVLTGTADHVESITHYNQDPVDNSFTSPARTYTQTFVNEFTYKRAITVGVGLSTTWTKEGGIAPFAKFKVEVSASFDFEYSQERTDTTVESDEKSWHWEANTKVCPARSKCERDFISYSSNGAEIPMSVTIQCPNNEVEVIEGTLKAQGTLDITVIDKQEPLDCYYYSNDYFDRHSGLLPFCDTCSSGDACAICRDNSILIDGGCYQHSICSDQCQGEIVYLKGGNMQQPSFSGDFCRNEDLSLQACQDALFQ